MSSDQVLSVTPLSDEGRTSTSSTAPSLPQGDDPCQCQRTPGLDYSLSSVSPADVRETCKRLGVSPVTTSSMGVYSVESIVVDSRYSLTGRNLQQQQRQQHPYLQQHQQQQQQQGQVQNQELSQQLQDRPHRYSWQRLQQQQDEYLQEYQRREKQQQQQQQQSQEQQRQQQQAAEVGLVEGSKFATGLKRSPSLGDSTVPKTPPSPLSPQPRCRPSRTLSVDLDFLLRDRGSVVDLSCRRSDWPLQFHDVHGENIELLNDKTRAKRSDSFCKGVCFSNRPVNINERVMVKFVETSSSWSGVLRFGFTSSDPSTLQTADLPRYACPDLTNKPGNWAKALGERYAVVNTILTFYVTRGGDVMYGINGEEKGLFFTGVITCQPLWVMLDIYGNTVAVEFMQPHSGCNQLPSPLSKPLNSSRSTSGLSVEQELLSFSHFSVNESITSGTAPPRYYGNLELSSVTFHPYCGKNSFLTPDRCTATRVQSEYCNAYVFMQRPLRCGERVVIQVLGVDRTYVGGLAFGLTACSPDTLVGTTLPDDSDLLLDRPEYWVVNKDVCRSPDIGDELSFYLTPDGEVRYSRNHHKVATLMHVDRTLPLWAVFDIYGNVQKIRMLGTTSSVTTGRSMPRSRSTSSYSGLSVNLPPRPPPPHSTRPRSAALTQVPNFSRSYSMPAQSAPLSPTSQTVLQEAGDHSASLPPSPATPTHDPQADNECNECTVCCERAVNSVMYTCGHMCMCYECAVAVKDQKGGLCPICRQPIKDVIKIYRS